MKTLSLKALTLGVEVISKAKFSNKLTMQEAEIECLWIDIKNLLA